MASKSFSPHFSFLQDFKVDFAPIQIAEYVSNRTGMRIVLVDQKGPKVLGYFALATEIHDDSGAPHTLEHLVFMGSKSYRYKGLLDKLATRAYSYTNAWTATDHTAYTLKTAGWEGFAQILPVYLEHILVPTLTDAGCYTEVHHVDGTGRDAGVVYSEMQGRQNQQGDRMMLRAQRLLYPAEIGFRYETGGMMESLRVITADKIRDFHKQMYQPKNLCIILVGEINRQNLFDILDRFESSILDDIPGMNEPFVRPWTKTGKTPRLTQSIVDVVEFPEDDESIGEILIGLFGPDCNDDVATAALHVLLNYLCGSSISILENTLVEKEQLASAVCYFLEYRPDTLIWFQLTGVKTKRLEEVEKRFFEVLDSTNSNPLNMDYLNDCLNRDVRQIKYCAETLNGAFSDEILTDHLFGVRDGSTLRQIGNLKCYEALNHWSESEWKQFLSRWIVAAKHVSILGKPSKKLSKKLKTEEKARVAAQQKKLGEAGLKQLQQKLDAAKEENDREIPPEVLNQFEVPGTDSIHFIPSTTAQYGFGKDSIANSNPIQKIIDQDKTNLPLAIHFEHIDSSFVSISLLLNTHQVPIKLRPLLSVYIQNFFDTPLLRNGTRVEYEDVVTQLERDTINYSITDASSLSNSEVLRIKMQLEPSKYAIVIGWLRDLLFNSIFDVDRLKSTLAKILADIPEGKRSGSFMASSALFIVQNTRDCSLRAQDTLTKSLYLRRISQMLEETPEVVIESMEVVRNALADPSNFRTLVIANLESGVLSKPVSSWEAFVSKRKSEAYQLRPLDNQRTCLSDAGKAPGKLNYVIPMSTIDSSYAIIAARGLDSYNHPLLPALTVTIAYLEVTEGPLWTAVRGTGLAYGVNFIRDIERNLLQFEVYRSPDVYKAISTSRKTIEDLVSGKVPLDSLAMEGAVSSVVVSFANEQPSAMSAATVGFVNQVIKSVDKNWGLEFMKKVRNVTQDEVRKAMKETVLPVFKVDSANLVATCATIMQEQLVEDLRKDGYSPEVQPLSFFCDTYDLEGADAVQEQSDDEDEDEEGEHVDAGDTKEDDDSGDDDEESEDDVDDQED